MEHTVKIVRLKSGEDVICELATSNGNIQLLGSPMRINLVKDPRSPNIPFILMSPWLPLHIIKDNNVEVKLDDILTSFDPTDDIVEYYSNSVHAYEDAVREATHQREEMMEEFVVCEKKMTVDEEDIEFVAWLKKANLLN